MPKIDDIRKALAAVQDPEIHRSIADLNMIGDISVSPEGAVDAEILLTTEACPLSEPIRQDCVHAIEAVDGVTHVTVRQRPMTDEEKTALSTKLRGGQPEPKNPFNEPGNTTRVYCVASGKGGVGKSSITANLAAAMAADGLSVGLIDADIYGFSIPRMLGTDEDPRNVGGMIMPVTAHGVKTISIGMMVVPGQPVIWRGPMLHRALQQFMTDVMWGDLDVLLLDLPPGTGDVAISLAQLLPNAEIVLVTTPQAAAAEVAQRSGAMALQTQQKVVGVIENMSWMEQPDGTKLALFGEGGGSEVAKNLSDALGTQVPVLGQVPIDIALREGGDSGEPVVIASPESSSAVALRHIAKLLER